MITRKESPFEKYELLEQVGTGSFGSVFKAREKINKETVAIKIMKKKFNSYSECTNLKEYKMLKRMSFHPNIVQLYETFITPTTKEFYLIMEYMNGGNLYQFINERNETNRIINLEEIKSILLQILSALSHIHQVEGIFHRDMKPENLLISYHPYHNKCGDNIIIKLADFGLAADIKKLTRSPYTDYVSTRWYRAPEVLLKSTNYTSSIDLWAVGTIFAELITLSPLFPGQSEIDQLFRICQILGSPAVVQPSSTTISYKKSYTILQPPNFITSKSSSRLQNNNVEVGIGGEWKEGIKLAHRMGFEFPKIVPKIESLSTVLHPHHISNDGIDLLSKLLQFDPSKRITANNALSHSFFMPSSSIIESTIVLPPIITTTSPKPTLFDLPIIPLSPFQLGEEYSQWDILMKNSSPTVHNIHLENKEQLPITRTTSYPNILYNNNEENVTSQQIYDNESHIMRRSVSDLSIPVNNLPPASPQQQKQQQQQKKKNRLSLWAKKHIIV